MFCKMYFGILNILFFFKDGVAHLKECIDRSKKTYRSFLLRGPVKLDGTAHVITIITHRQKAYHLYSIFTKYFVSFYLSESQNPTVRDNS